MMSVLQKKISGGRLAVLIASYDYLFGPGKWLTDRYNGYQARCLTVRRFEWPVHSFR